MQRVALFSSTVLPGQAKHSFIEHYVIVYMQMATSFSAWHCQALLCSCFQVVEQLTPLFQYWLTVFARIPSAASTKTQNKLSCYVTFP
jgi:hypothetical protein